MFLTLFEFSAAMSQTAVRQIGALGAGIILLACLLFELKAARPRWFTAGFWSVVVVAAGALAFALSHLEVAKL